MLRMRDHRNPIFQWKIKGHKNGGECFNQVGDRLGLSVPLQALFEKPTKEELAIALDKLSALRQLEQQQIMRASRRGRRGTRTSKAALVKKPK